MNAYYTRFVSTLSRFSRTCLVAALVLIGASVFVFGGGKLLFDFKQPGDSGHIWTGWTWTANPDGYDSPGWRSNSAVDYNGGGDWRPRSYVKNDGGQGADGTIDRTMRAPSASSGGSLKITQTRTDKTASWWGWVGPNTMYRLGYTDDSTNRMSFYARYSGTADCNLRTTQPFQSRVHIGTYLHPDDNTHPGSEIDHYYHYIGIVNDVWLHVVLDRHPQHERGIALPPVDNPKGPTYPYYHNLASFYWDIAPYDHGSATTAWYDDVQLWTQSQAENDISISSLWVGYRASDRTWLLQFQDTSWTTGYGNSSVGTYEIRWSTTPITNDNWSSATPITPLYWAKTGSGAGAGRIARNNPWMLLAYTEFQLPAGTEAANRMLYFAIKDVSSLSYGDGHNSPSAYVKTIDYSLIGTIAAPGNVKVVR